MRVLNRKISDLQIPGVKLIRDETFYDERGSLSRYLDRDLLLALTDLDVEGESVLPVPTPSEHLVSRSRQSVLRGMHYQSKGHGQAKLVQCIAGCIRDVVLDLRTGQWLVAELADADMCSLLVPPWCAHGFMTLGAETSTVHYTLWGARSPNHEGVVRWNSFGANWGWDGSTDPILSERDAQAKPFEVGAGGWKAA